MQSLVFVLLAVLPISNVLFCNAHSLSGSDYLAMWALFYLLPPTDSHLAKCDPFPRKKRGVARHMRSDVSMYSMYSRFWNVWYGTHDSWKYGTKLYGTIPDLMIHENIVWNGMVPYHMVWNGVVWYHIIWIHHKLYLAHFSSTVSTAACPQLTSIAGCDWRFLAVQYCYLLP